MSTSKKISKKQILPVLPLRGITVFPHMILHFDVGRNKSIKALEDAMVHNQLIFLATQKDPQNDGPSKKDLYTVGTISKVKQLLKLPGEAIRVLVEGVNRAQIKEFTQIEPFFMAEVAPHTGKPYPKDAKTEALKRQMILTFEEYVKLNHKISSEVMVSIMAIEDTEQLSDIIAANLFLKVEEKQELLSLFEPKKRMEKLIECMLRETQIMEIEKDIGIKVRKQIEKTQKEYYLREQLKAIQNELGEKDGIMAEIEEYHIKAKKSNLPDEVYKKVLKELDKLTKIPTGSAEGTVVRNYLEWIFDLPWNIKTTERIDLSYAKEILDEDHYGLTKVKERILEYLAVRKMKSNLKGPIICLLGPPGVGKTSIAKSIAKALNRNYVRMSLGGVKDESEIRGHRRTYVGSMPGRIINALKQAGSTNPLILLDEIDKMSSDYRGDPASAMLEVLDSEQNFSFRDHFMELPYDLSDVLFLTTANHMESIPRPLLDRLEIIPLSSYTDDEKFHIAAKYLIPKQILAHGMKKSAIKLNDIAIKDVIHYYTRESGVRNLERQFAHIFRKAARKMIDENKKTLSIGPTQLEKYLGAKKFLKDRTAVHDEIGVATGLAWTPVGGDILYIEVLIVPGKGKLELTGHLGDIMKESAKAAISYIRSRVDFLGIDKEFYSQSDIHIHVPEGATPKDGPSAGITLLTAMVSALTKIPVKHSVAMTGEITLRGRVLAIGGLKEKIYAAHRSEIKTVIVPYENRKDLEDIPENILKNLNMVFAQNVETVLKTALTEFPPAKAEPYEASLMDKKLLKKSLTVHDETLDLVIEQ
jgi:ATP-dependent Lon protease